MAGSATAPFGSTARAALVTGAGRGIGRAVALALAAAGAELVLVSRTAERARRGRREIASRRRQGAAAAVRRHPIGRGARRLRRSRPARHPRQQCRAQPAATLSRGRRADPRPAARAQCPGGVSRRAGGGAADGRRGRRRHHQHVVADGACRLRARPHRLCDDQARGRRADQGDGGRAGAQGRARRLDRPDLYHDAADQAVLRRPGIPQMGARPHSAGPARHGRGGGVGGRLPRLARGRRSSPVRACSSMAAGPPGDKTASLRAQRESRHGLANASSRLLRRPAGSSQ